MAKVAVGKKVPRFKADATSGTAVSAAALAGKPYVLYFYPKDATPGCTSEGEEFRDLHAKFQDAGIVVLGCSRDTLASHEKFKAKHGFPFELIADTEEALCDLFDVIKEKSLYGRKFMGIERSTFLVDAAGVLRAEWRKVKVKGHAANVLQTALSLES
jgi:peroxiredoxin Q/BCP